MYAPPSEMWTQEPGARAVEDRPRAHGVLFDPFSQSDFKSSVYCVPSLSVTLQAAFHSTYHQAPSLTMCVCVSAFYKLPRSYSFRGQLKCDGTRAETRFRLSAKRTSPFKSAGPSVQSTTGSRGVRISGSNAGYTMFRGSVKGTA